MSEKTRAPRRPSSEVLSEQVVKQPLAEKVRLMTILKDSIQEDKKNLEEQLKLINQ